MTGKSLMRGRISITLRSAARSASRRATTSNTSRHTAAGRLERLEEFRDHVLNAIRQIDKLDPRPIHDDVLIHIRDVRVGDPALEHHRLLSEREAQVVKGVEVEGKACLDRGAPAAHLLDVQRLEHHDFALKIAEDEDALAFSLGGIGHPRRNIARAVRSDARALGHQFMRNAARAGIKSSSSSASCEMAASKSCPSYSVV